MSRSSVLPLIFLAAIFSCQSPKTDMTFPPIPVKYPETRIDSVSDTYFGRVVPDPYRWLENDTAADVEAWVARQNEVTFGYLEQIPFRNAIRKRYEALFNFPKMGLPSSAGDYIFFGRNDGLQNQSVIYRQKGLDGEPELFLDPNTLTADGTAAIELIGFSPDHRYVAYSRSDAGSDWSQIRVREVASGRELDDKLDWVKFSQAAWSGEGFYYSRMPEPESGMELSAANRFHSVYYHRLGDPQSADRLIYRNPDAPLMYHWTTVTEDQKYLVLYASTGTDGFETSVLELAHPEKGFQTLFPGFDHKSTVIDHHQGRFLVHTDIDAPNYRLIYVDPAQPDTAHWSEVIPESPDLLTAVTIGGGKWFAHYLRKANTRILCLDPDNPGQPEEISLPGLGFAEGFTGLKDDPKVFYTYMGFVDPGSIFTYDPISGKSDLFFRTELAFDPDEYTSDQVFYKSKDGTEVSMFLVYRKGMVKDGNNPCLLYGYGGFNNNQTPYFSTARIMLLENGGIFAMPNLRGGGEYGEEWHKAGMLKNKQNVFDDMISAAEFLISEGYTSSKKLGIAGGSNGGLLVGACVNQRPDLFQVAFPAVGVMDMLRYHKFTVGWGWVPEYGSSEDSTMFPVLLSYSPYHNLMPGTRYPATLVTTADHDDRVVPAHSFKYAARMQACQAGDKPVLIRIETSAGHGAGKPTSKIIDEQADIWSFLFYNTETPVIYSRE